MQPYSASQSAFPWSLVILAALAGGMAEVVWVGFYSAFTPLSAAEVARQVTWSFAPSYGAGAAFMGFVIHMALAVALGLAYAAVIWRPFARTRGPVATIASSFITLAIVWTVNFFAVLPQLNPTFITLMPYPITFASKMWFALAMAVALVGVDYRHKAAATADRVG